MTKPSPELADPQRKLQTPEWYDQNQPNSNKLSWRLHLCVTSQVIDDFIPQVRAVLQEAASAGCPIDRDASSESLLAVAAQLRQLRPDLCCPRLPLTAVANVVRSMAVKLNESEPPSAVQMKESEPLLKRFNSEPTSKRKADDEPISSKRPVKVSRLPEQIEPSFATTRQDQIDQLKEYANRGVPQQGSKSRENTGSDSFNGTELSEANRIVALPQPVQTITSSSDFTFNIELITISLLDPERIGNIQIAPLKTILNPHRVYDVRTCAGLELNNMASVFEAFDPSKEQLWCEIEEIEHRVTCSETFAFLCRWQIEDSLAKNPHIPPRIRFERRPEITANGSGSIGRNVRLENADRERSDSTSSSSSLWTRNVPRSTSKGTKKSSPTALDDSQIKYDTETLADDLDVAIGRKLEAASDSDQPLLHSLETKDGRSKGKKVKSNVNSDAALESPSPLSDVIVVSGRGLSQRQSTMSDQLLSDFQKPLFPTPSLEGQEVPHGEQKDKKKKKKRSKKHRQQEPQEEAQGRREIDGISGD